MILDVRSLLVLWLETVRKGKKLQTLNLKMNIGVPAKRGVPVRIEAELAME